MRLRITWVSGYGAKDGESEVHGRSWFSEEMGFDEYDRNRIAALLVGESFQTGGPTDQVHIERVR